MAVDLRRGCGERFLSVYRLARAPVRVRLRGLRPLALELLLRGGVARGHRALRHRL